MKLLTIVMLSVLAAGLIGLTAFAQDLPAADGPATMPASTGAEGSTDAASLAAERAVEGDLLTPALQEAAAGERGIGTQGGAAPAGDTNAVQAGTADPAPGSLEAQAAERQIYIDTIVREMGLPPEQDTGTRAPNFWMPQSASAQAPQTDGVFWFIMWVTIFFTVGITAAMIWFAIKYRRRHPEQEALPAATHSTTLEITWTLIPTCIVLLMFVVGFKGFLQNTIAPPNAYEVQVMGRMWNWSFTYPNGATTADLHIPKDRPVKFILQSEDVLHDLYIPAYRLKKDAVPGRYNSFWVEPTVEGVFDIFCAEYCGTNHSRMGAKVFVYPPERYNEMLARISNIYEDPWTGEPVPPSEVGLALWQQRGCIGCHSADGSAINAPTWKGLWGATRQFTDGTTATADEAYIRESIYYPQRKIVQGWGNAMASYLGQLDNRDIDSLIAYMKTLSDDAKVTPGGDVVTPEESQSLPEDVESDKAKAAAPGTPSQEEHGTP